MFRRCFLLLILLMLTSCGFHLRGIVDLPPPLKRMYLQMQDPYGDLARSIKLNLKLSGVVLTPTPTDASTILILREETAEQLLSVGGTQQTRQYNLVLTVIFAITDINGNILVPPQPITANRILTIQSSQILGGSNEEINVFKQMRRDITSTVMNRLASKDVAEKLATIKTH